MTSRQSRIASRQKAWIHAIAAGLLVVLFAGGMPAAERDGRWAILIFGVSGDPDLQKQYLQELTDLRAVLEHSYGFPRGQIVALFDDPSKDPVSVQHKSTREELQSACLELAERVQPEDLVFVFIEGHGDYDGKTYKLNLVGPDPTAEDLDSILYAIPSAHFVIVNATNCSGGSIGAFSRKGTIVIAATKSGMEKNITHLGRYFINALQNNSGDSDKSGRVSILEAFSYTKQKVEEFYTGEGTMQTEHPVLDDMGSKKGEAGPSPENGMGLLARTVFLDKGASPSAATLTSEQQQLEQEARSLEREIEALKYSKDTIPEPEYEKQLESLLLKLARINAQISK